MMTWNAKGACFAKSEYDDVVYRMGSREGLDDDDWPPFQDTLREWNAETGFKWGDVAYLNLDPRDSDQFVAIRTDGTWAGSIDADANEEALEAFALSFFAQTKTTRASTSKPNPRPKTNSRPQPPPQTQHNHNSKNNSSHRNRNSTPRPAPTPIPVTHIPDATSQAHYERWATETATMLALALATNSNLSPDPTPRSTSQPPKKIQIRNLPTSPIPTPLNGAAAKLTTFPYLPAPMTTCHLHECMASKADSAGLRACKHDVERLLRASGLYSYEWLRQERIRWHPDRFGRLCEDGFSERGRKLSEEMFKIVDGLVGEAEGKR